MTHSAGTINNTLILTNDSSPILSGKYDSKGLHDVTDIALVIFTNKGIQHTLSSSVLGASQGWVIGGGTWSVNLSTLQTPINLSHGSYHLALQTLDSNFNAQEYSPSGLELTIDTHATINIDLSGTYAADGYISASELSNPLSLAGMTTGIENGQFVDVTLTDSNSNTATALGLVNSGAWTLVELQPYTETLVNATIASYQMESSVAALSDGGYAIVWHSASSSDIYVQRYDVESNPVGSETLVNSTTFMTQDHASITGLSGGGYVIVWQSFNQDDANDKGIYLQRYDSSNNLIGTETLVNTTTVGGQERPEVTGLSDGGYVVTWMADTPGNVTDIYTQRYDSLGDAVGSETQINTYTANTQHYPDITELNDGGYIVTWSSELQDSDSYGIYAQRYDSAGVSVGGETLINTTTAGNQGAQKVASLTDGGYVVAWSSFGQDGSAGGVYTKRYDGTDVPVGGETLVNTFTNGNQNSPDITGLTDGGYVITWDSFGQDGNLTGIYAQRYDSANNLVGPETLINTTTLNDQESPSITGLNDGGYVITWQSKDQDGNNWGVYSQRFAADGSRVGTNYVESTVDISGFVEGSVTIDVSSADLAGNVATAQNTDVAINIMDSPTVYTVDTSNTRTWLRGSFDSENTDELTITIDGETYTLGVDANLYPSVHSDNTWVLRPQNFYHLGVHDIQVTATNNEFGISRTDSTTSELTITRDMFAPRVNPPKQIYNKRPAIGGSFDEAATETLTVELDGTVYTLGVDAELDNHLNNKWVLNLSTLEIPLSDGVYDIVVNTTDANNITLQDASTGELTIGMLAPTVYELESTNFKPVLRGFYDADFGDGLTVTVNGDSYTLGVDSELTTHVSNDYVWVLRPSNALNFGDNDIELVATDTKGKEKTDITSDEIHIYQTKSQSVNGDVLITQAGNDTITINDNSFTTINAGEGLDTLILEGNNIEIDFSKVQGIDVVDMGYGIDTTNTLTLTLNDLLTQIDNNHLLVLGDTSDTLVLEGNWLSVVPGVESTTYELISGTDTPLVSLLIEQGITVEIV